MSCRDRVLNPDRQVIVKINRKSYENMLLDWSSRVLEEVTEWGFTVFFIASIGNIIFYVANHIIRYKNVIRGGDSIPSTMAG